MASSQIVQLSAVCALLASQVAAGVDHELNISPKLRATLAEADSYEAVAPSHGSSPKVKMNSYVLDGDYSYTLVDLSKDNFGKIGFEASYFADFYAGYSWPAFWLYRQAKNWMVINPTVYLSTSAGGEIVLKLSVIEVIFKLQFLIGEITPFDYQFAWDLDQKGDYCSSLGGSWEVLDIKLLTEYHINECSFGAIGGLMKALDIIKDQDYKDCTWRRYSPQTPIWIYTAQDQGDSAWDYSEWYCSIYDDLETTENTRATVDENGNEIENPVGYDDLPEEEEEIVWEYDPSNVVIE